MSMTDEARSAGKPVRLVGAIVMAMGGALLALWLSARDSDRHGAFFLLGGGVVFALIGASIWTIGYSITMVRRRRR